MATIPPPAARRTGFRDVIGVAEFRSMWFAEILSVCGDQLARVALSVIVYSRTHSAVLTGLTYALTFAPSLIGGVALTGLADRFPRRDLMAAIDAVRCLLVCAMALPGMPLWLMVLLVSGVSLLNPPVKAAQLALLPQVLAGDRFPVGLALRNITNQSAQLAGFAGGGLLIAAVDPRVALLLDGATFAASALLIRCGLAHRPAAAGPRRTSLVASVRDGGRLAFADPATRTLVLFTWVAGLLPVYEGIAAPYVAATGGGATAVGLLLASDPLGSALGAFCYARWVPAALRPRLIGPITLLSAVPLLFCFLRPGPAVSMALFVVTGALGTVGLMQATASLTLAVPDDRRGQLMGLSNSGLTAVMGLTPLAGGLLADRISPPTTVGAFGVAGLVIAVPLALAWHRHLTKRTAAPADAR
jgi:predicted MFS family arabinose efflux permease